MNKRIGTCMEKALDLQDKALCCAASGKYDIDSDQMYLLVDIIKDMSEAVANNAKACKEELETKAMEGETNGYGGDVNIMRMGYDNWRYAGGQFAPKGHGHYAGYRPMDMGMANGPYDPNRMMEHEIYGYDSSNDRRANSGRNGYDHDSAKTMDHSYNDRMGYSDGRSSYDDYRAARRHYQETKSDEDKSEMSKHARHHVKDMIGSMKDIWNSSDPELKKELKADMAQFVNDLKA